MKTNNTSFFILYRPELTVRMKHLTDREKVLLIHCIAMAGWDQKNKKTYGVVKKTIRKIKTEQLPNWATGKISEVINLLIKKGFLAREKSGELIVVNYWIYRSKPHKAELAYQLVEQGIQPTEQNVQDYEQSCGIEVKNTISNIATILAIPTNYVQETEQSRHIKEN